MILTVMFRYFILNFPLMHFTGLWGCKYPINMHQLNSYKAHRKNNSCGKPHWLNTAVPLNNSYKVSYVTDAHVRKGALMPTEHRGAHVSSSQVYTYISPDHHAVVKRNVILLEIKQLIFL